MLPFSFLIILFLSFIEEQTSKEEGEAVKGSGALGDLEMCSGSISLKIDFCPIIVLLFSFDSGYYF